MFQSGSSVRKWRAWWRACAVLAATGLLGLASSRAWSQGAPRQDPLRQVLTARAERTVLTDQCSQCHKSEFAVWNQTKHAAGFADLHTRDSAKAIYRQLGLRVIKRGSDEETPACLQCHYTPVLRANQLQAGAGVSCESCHGPARDWLPVHNNYGIKEENFQVAAKRETEAHRTERIGGARAAGMQRPSDLYGVAANCFGCHTVPSEDLVNRGGHSTGSNFEFVAWSQGVAKPDAVSIRHNFLDSFKTGDGRTNAERSPARKRVMFVVGRALDLEYGLRAVALATVEGRYFDAVSQRANVANENLLEIFDAAPIPEIRSAVEVFSSVELKVRNRASLEGAAGRIGELTRQFIARTGGAANDLAALDPLWDAKTKAVPKVERPQPAAAPTAVEPTPAAAPAATTTRVAPPAAGPSAAAGIMPVPAAGPTTGTAPAATAAAASTPARTQAAPPASAARASYPVLPRPPWRPESTHDFVQVPCSRCHEHANQEKVWRADAHSNSLAPFSRRDPKVLAIATKYGIAPDNIRRSDQICMSCHGTSIKRRVSQVYAGVGCQQCHGAGQDYEEKHQPEKGFPYATALAQGMTDLKNAGTRVRVCESCHYITDPGLLAADHKSGSDFDIAAAMVKIRHWGADFGGKAVDIPAATLKTAQAEAVKERGPVPAVTAARAPTVNASAAVVVAPPADTRAESTTVPPASSTSQSATVPSATVPSASAAPTRGAARAEAGASASAQPSSMKSARPAVPGVTPAAPPAQEPVAEPPPADAPAGDASVEETLLQLKRRLEALYKQRDR